MFHNNMEGKEIGHNWFWLIVVEHKLWFIDVHCTILSTFVYIPNSPQYKK